MKIEKLELNNFRSARNTVFDFESQLNLFVGVNGAGKSTVLDALSICLSWLAKRIERDNKRGNSISESDISNGEDESSLTIHATNMNSSWQWLLNKSIRTKPESKLDEVTKLAQQTRESSKNNTSLPIIAYYPVNRVVGAISPTIPKKDSLYSLDIYENALGGKANYQIFFEWFRLQDDILNEESTSRSKWIRRNRSWIKKRIHRLISLMEKTILDSGSYGDYEGLRYFIRDLKNDEMIYKTPQFLLLHLYKLVDYVAHADDIGQYEIVLPNIQNMLDQINSIDRELMEDLIDENIVHKETLYAINNGFKDTLYYGNPNGQIVGILWEVFSFALLLRFWWFSEKGKRNLEFNYFEVISKEIRDEERKNACIKMEEFSEILQQTINQELQQKQNAHRSEGHELDMVANAIEQFLPEYTNLRVKRVPRPHMLIDKNEETFDLGQLSDGEKSLVALVGDIARRLAIGNTGMKNPLEGEGVILIDEIDLHLHPNWQRLVVPKLLEVFPNCQFFISTHSPQVISHVKPESVFLLEQTEMGLSYKKVEETFGMSLNRIVELVMNDESRPEAVIADLDKIFELIERKRFDKAKELVSSLKMYMPNDPEIMRAEVFIRQGEMAK